MHRFFLGAVCKWEPTPTVLLFEQLCCNGVTRPETLERIRPCQLEMEHAQMMTTGCKSTLSRKARRRAKAKTRTNKGIRSTNTKNTSNTDINTCKNCGETGHCTKNCWRPGGGAYDKSTNNNTNTQKGKHHKKRKSESKHVDIVETNQSPETASTVLYPSQTPSTIGALSCNSHVEPWIMGVTINSVSSTRRQAGAEHLLLGSDAQLHACPIKCPGQKAP